MEQLIVFVDDAHAFGGAQIALAWGVRALLRNTEERIVCVCTPRTLMAPRMVGTFHCRPGVASWMRLPPTQPPQSRVIEVVTPLSSR